MSDRLKQAVGKFATIRSVAVVALVAVGAIAAVVAAPAFSHRAIAAGCNNGLNVDTQYNTGACVGEITSGNFVTDYIIVVVDAAATNGVKVPTDIAAGIVLGGITGHQVFNFIPNTSAVNEYVGKPDIQADPTKANQYGNVGVSIPMAKNCSAANSTDALTVSATSPGTGETQKATINFCDIQRDTKQHGYFEKVTLQFSKAGTTSSSAQCSGGALGWIICPVVDFLIGTMQF